MRDLELFYAESVECRLYEPIYSLLIRLSFIVLRAYSYRTYELPAVPKSTASMRGHLPLFSRCRVYIYSGIVCKAESASRIKTCFRLFAAQKPRRHLMRQARHAACQPAAARFSEELIF